MKNKSVFTGYLLEGAINKALNLVDESVCATLGPEGRTAIIERPGYVPTVTKDGVTVANQLASDTKEVNVILELIREAAQQTAREAGDGTTTATVLAVEMIRRAHRHLKNNKGGMRTLLKDMESTINALTKVIKALSANSPLKDVEAIKRIATTSCNGDKDLGASITEIITNVTEAGSIEVLHGLPGDETNIEYSNGLKISKGVLSSTFKNKSDKAEYEDCHVLLADEILSTESQLVPLLQLMANQTKDTQKDFPVIVICQRSKATVLELASNNVLQCGCKIIIIEAEDLRASRTALFEDLALYTGGRVFSAKTGAGIRNVTLEDLGKCKRVTSNDAYTVLIGGQGDKQKLNDHYTRLHTEFTGGKASRYSTFDRERFEQRLRRLCAKNAVMYVGGNTEAEINELKDRVDDSICAVMSAINMGVIPGGGFTLFKCAKRLVDEYKSTAGVKIVVESVMTLAIRILSNAGHSNTAISNALNALDTNDLMVGLDYNTLEPIRLDEAGILDPTKVSVSALKYSFSVAQVLLRSSSMIVHNTRLANE